MKQDDKTRRLRDLTRNIVQTYESIGGINRIGEKNLPSQQATGSSKLGTESCVA